MDNKSYYTLTFVGDVMLARGVQDTILEYGADYVLNETADILRNSNFVFGNMESPLSYRGKPNLFKNVCFRADPKTASLLSYGKFKVMSLANNHIFDYGEEALLDTIDNLRKIDVIPVGAGDDKSQAYKPVIFNLNDLKIGIISATKACEATKRKSDQPQAALANEKLICSIIRSLKKTTDLVVLSLHMGVEFCSCPSINDYKLCMNLLNCGADIIIGSHPHVLQGLWAKNGKVVAFSLGNFIFDKIEEAKDDQRVVRSGILQVFVSEKKIVGHIFIPIYVHPSGRIYVMRGKEKFDALSEFNNLSNMINEEYIKKNFWKFASNNAISSNVPVLIKKIKEHGLIYCLQMFPNVRPRHVRFLFVWVKNRLIRSFKRTVERYL